MVKKQLLIFLKLCLRSIHLLNHLTTNSECPGGLQKCCAPWMGCQSITSALLDILQHYHSDNANTNQVCSYVHHLSLSYECTNITYYNTVHLREIAVYRVNIIHKSVHWMNYNSSFCKYENNANKLVAS